MSQSSPARHDILERLDSSHRTACAAERDRLAGIVECDRAGLWEGDGFATLQAWLAARYGISPWKARRMTEAAYALESLPRTAAALSCGAVSLDKVVELCRFATPENEGELIMWARRVSPAAIRKKADSLQRATDAAEPGRNRYLSMYWTHDDALAIDGLLPQEQGLRVKAAIDRVAKGLPDLPIDEVSAGIQPLDRKRADALALIASNAIAQDADPDRATVVVHASLEALASDTYACESEDGVALHPDVARRLACDCRYQVVATGKNGDVGIGRVAHDVPRWLRRLVSKRDGGCAFPGCGMKTFLHPHHIVHWVLGGPTDLSNLVMLCSIHHTLVHEHHWSVILEDQIPVWFRPSGGLYECCVPLGDGLENERQREMERARARGPSPGSIEERFGLENFRLKEISSSFAGDMYEVARSLVDD
ncbi:MAG: hypothetical protein QOF16_1182 [Actinomycetota bacterium]|nr:hypothetical protein [Actinomycetota bacterium]